MPYVKHKFTNGMVLESSDLNDIENAIVELDSSYSGHNFANGMYLKAKYLDEMEDKIVELDSSYTKHNFTKGTVLEAVELDEIEDELVDLSHPWNFANDYRTELDDIISKIKTIQQTKDAASHVEFIVYSDMHKDTIDSEPEFYRMMNAIRYLTHRLDIAFVANLGDICYSSDGSMDKKVFNELLEYSKELNSPYVITMGNHDYIPHNDRRNMATNFENAVFDTVGSWFYVDDNRRNLRYIVLDSQDRGNDANVGTSVTTNSNACSDRSWNQLNWFANVALKTKNRVIIMQHQGLGAINSSTVREHSHIDNYKIACTIAEAFQAGIAGSTKYKIYYSAETTAKNTVTWDFSDQGAGTILFNAFGHVHGDTLYNSTTSTSTPFNEFTFDNALCRDSTYVGTNFKRTLNTITEIAFDIVSVDLENNKVNCYRCCAGNDREYNLLLPVYLPLTSVKIEVSDTISGIEVTPGIVYSPLDTTSTSGFKWSIQSGGEYASIDEDTGEITIDSSASNNVIVIRVVSIDQPSIYDEATVSITYAPPGKLTNIEVTSQPYKTLYAEGSIFSPNGMIVTAYYDNGSSSTVKNYSYSPTSALTMNDKEIVVSYTLDGIICNTTLPITVSEPTEVDISDRFSFTVLGPILWADGTQNTTNKSSYGSDYADISGFNSLYITQLVTTATSTVNGLAFYDADKKYISGVSQITGGASMTIKYNTIEIPPNAVYARTTWWKADDGSTGTGSWSGTEFSCIASI